MLVGHPSKNEDRASFIVIIMNLFTKKIYLFERNDIRPPIKKRSCDHYTKVVIDSLLSKVTVAELLDGKLIMSKRNVLRDYLLCLAMESESESEYSVWVEKMEERCKNVMELYNDLQSILMLAQKKRVNTDENEDHIDG